MVLEDDVVDHYVVLGLPSGEEGAALGLKEIEKAYKLKARELHPDKRRDDPDATAAFQNLISSYELLKDTEARKAFDSVLRTRRERILRQSRYDSKRRKFATDLEERERAAAFAENNDPEIAAKRAEREAAARLKAEMARIHAKMRTRMSEASGFGAFSGGGLGAERDKQARTGDGDGDSGRTQTLEKEKMLKVSWERVGSDYTSDRLKEIFTEFGEVEDVLIKIKKKKGTAVVVMSSKDAAVAAAHSQCGDPSNPLLVLPFEPNTSVFSTSGKPSNPIPSNIGNIVGAGYQAFEDSVLQKLQQASRKEHNS